MARPTDLRPILHAEYFAPWCEKARWALDHHRIAYAYREHAPLLGEVTLRLASRSVWRRVTVPMLIVGRTVLGDSLEICGYAERHGAGVPLVPAGREHEILDWNRRSEALMRAGRARLLERLARMPGALAQWPVPSPALGPALRRRVARLGVRFLATKYRGAASTAAEVDAALANLRTALAAGDGHVLAGTLSLADIAMATALQFVRPVDDAYLPLPPAVREAWTDPDAAARCGDLLAWRDALYAGHRAPFACGPPHAVRSRDA